MKKLLLLLLLLLLLASMLHGAIDCTKASNTQEFVKRFYTVILHRPADNTGMDDWTNKLLSRSQTGADIAKGFIFSAEYNINSKSNTQYLNDLYNAFFNRAPDQGGFDGWMSQLNSGTSRAEVLDGFLYSQEFLSLANSYGIQAYKGAAFQSDEIDNFVKRFYQVILGRTADSAGLADWTNKLSTGTSTGADIAKGFIFSAEYNINSKTNTQYLSDLYSAFFNRDPDQGGFDGWMNLLNSGTSRAEVLEGFLGSQEFINLSNSYGIVAFEGAPIPSTTNTPPVANAGIDQSIRQGELLLLDGSASSDSDGSIVCYWWKSSFGTLSTTVTYSDNTSPVGTNRATLTVIDDKGVSASDSVMVTVKEKVIVADTIEPTITLIGDANITIEVGSIYVDLGANAVDNVDGNITEHIVVDNRVNSSVIGVYNVSYNVSDQAGNAAQTAIRTVHVVAVPNGYGDLGSKTPKYYSNNKAGDQKYIAYYPENAITPDMPVVMFIKGGGSSTIENYSGMMQFLASKGYFVIGVDANSYASWYITGKLEIALNEMRASYGLNVSKLAIMGHSLGGGQAFYAMKKFRDDGYGNAGSLALSIDGWFAFNMDQIDLNLLNTKVSFLQMNGVSGTGTDPRIHLKIWNLATQSEKSFYTLPSTNHSYVGGDLANVLAKQDLVFAIGALTDDAFTGVNDGANAIPATNKASYGDIFNALDVESSYNSGDCAGIQYNAINVIQNNDIDYCDLSIPNNNAVTLYIPDPLPTNMLQNEAMNMDPNHQNFDKWINTENIVNGHLELVSQFDDAPYTLPRDIWLPHHKYTVVWDMETTGNLNEDTFPIVRFSSLGYFSQGNQNSVLNTKETLYTVIVSKDDLVNNSYKGFNFSRRDTIANSTMKISNIRIYEGVIELAKPVLKETNFQGTVAMDKEGVFRRNGKVIFPMNIYKDNTLITRGVRSIDQYLNQGITGTIMEAHSEHWYGARDEKLSKMIEGGMTTMSVPITNYLKNPNYAVGTNYFIDFSTIMQTLKQNAQMWNGIAALSIDNEFYHKNQQFRDAIEAIRNIIPDKPIQMLNGTEAISAWYNDYIDITGTYIASDIEVKIDHLEGTTNIHLMESQRLSPNLHVPVTLLQINQGTGENFGAILMAGVALGGTKLEYWKDDDEIFHGFRNLDMPTLPMWNQLPILRTYLDKMCDLGIIETTPYIGFKIKQTNDKYEYIKARLGKDNIAYIIASNMTSMANESTVQFSQIYKGLHYVPSGQLKDIMTGEVKGTIDTQNKKVNITLAPHTWVVLEVEKQ